MKYRYAFTIAVAVLTAAGAAAALELTGGANASTARNAVTLLHTSTAVIGSPHAAHGGPQNAAQNAAQDTAQDTAQGGVPHIVLDCAGKPQLQPSAFVWTCADDGAGIKDMRWTSWAPQLAGGYGTFWQNDCIPDCAAGKVVSYPVLATLWGSGTVQSYGPVRRYTELTLTFTGSRPPVAGGPDAKPAYPLTQTFGLS